MAARLWPLEPLGLEWRSAPGEELVVAYFREGEPRDGLAALPYPVVADRLLPDADWLAAPPAPGPGGPPPPLPPGTPFGVGGPDSTRLAWELAENLGLAAGARVLDVGCGTGILAFGAGIAGARWTAGYDLDPAAALLAGQYARLNGLPVRFFAGPAAALAAPARFDLLFVNVIPAEIGPELPALRALLAPAGTALFSGLLVTEASEAVARLAAAGFVERARRAEEEWVALACSGR